MPIRTTRRSSLLWHQRLADGPVARARTSTASGSRRSRSRRSALRAEVARRSTSATAAACFRISSRYLRRRPTRSLPQLPRSITGDIRPKSSMVGPMKMAMTALRGSGRSAVNHGMPLRVGSLGGAGSVRVTGSGRRARLGPRVTSRVPSPVALASADRLLRTPMRRRVEPASMTESVVTTRAVCPGVPSTWVPLVDPRSRATTPSPSRCSSRCARDRSASSRARSASWPRPIVSVPIGSGTDRPASGPAHVMTRRASSLPRARRERGPTRSVAPSSSGGSPSVA